MTSAANFSAAARLIAALRRAEAFDHPVGSIELLETHISWVLLTGPFAYKIKKPVDLGFADFSSLPKRRFFCHEELRLNRRLAPQIYLDVVAIGGTPDEPRVGGPGEPLEFAVKMRQVSAPARLDRVLARSELTAGHVDRLAETLATFHRQAGVAEADSAYGGDRAYDPIQDTFDHLSQSLSDPELRGRVATLERWAAAQFATHRGTHAERKRQRRVRECHGDLHLENMLLVDDRVVPFDCLEFNDRLRWIDVQSDLAFAVMDLVHRNRRDLAFRLLNRYLEVSGDYNGLVVLPLFLAYRALVRAKVAGIRAAQDNASVDERRALDADCRRFFDVAEQFADRGTPLLIATHGPSGSGKSAASAGLAEQLGAIRIRSDVERKRLFGLPAAARSGSERAAEIYSPQATRRTYDRLCELSRQILAAGWSAIVDATFLSRAERDRQRRVAEESAVPCVWLDFHGSADLLRQRVRLREATGEDPSEADSDVLERQLAERDPLQPDELVTAVRIDAAAPPTSAGLAELVRRRVAAIGPSGH